MENTREDDDYSIRFMVVSGVNLNSFINDKNLAKDNFKVFQNMLKTANQRDNDFVLILGNLFNDPKPLNTSVAAALSCLKANVIPSDGGREKMRKTSFECKKKKLNSNVKYLDISLPIFAIHGQKDGPRYLENVVSPLEILSQSSILNYFGRNPVKENQKKEEVFKIEPVLVKKRRTKLALYFLTHLRETKLSKMLVEKRVEFVHPGGNDYVKILILHQKFDSNPYWDKSVSSLQIHPDLIPKVFNYVLWADEKFKKNEVVEKEGYKLIKISSTCPSSLLKSDLRERNLFFAEFERRQFSHEEVKIKYPRPVILMSLTAERIDLSAKDGRVEVTRSEQSIKDEVMKRLGIYYQQGHDLPGPLDKPIFRVLIINERKKYLNLKHIEERLCGLVANEM